MLQKQSTRKGQQEAFVSLFWRDIATQFACICTLLKWPRSAQERCRSAWPRAVASVCCLASMYQLGSSSPLASKTFLALPYRSHLKYGGVLTNRFEI